ncbi:MAG: branched-chain amino acid ABC transporter substrate-binding protein [Solirubrobacteraceae bacterium]|nr:branched-chain amino acid ABC transporter substrate-binding protein [Solirubrobacteraceae bacterium]
MLSAVGIAACGDDDDDAGSDATTGATAGGELTIYSSLPLQGGLRTQSAAMVNGIRLALKEADNKAGNFTIKYESLDDSTAQAGNWTPEAVSANARRAAQDDSTAVFIGEFNSGASAVSIPILSDAKVPQLSPANTAVGLTSDEPGAEPGEPAKYYPSGFRNFVRIVPKDTIQGAALATVMKEDGCTKVVLANDKEVYGAGLARNVVAAAEAQDLEVLFNEGIDPRAANYRALASRARGQDADCFVFAGTTPNNAVQIFKDFGAALPEAKLYGPDGVSDSAFADEGEGGIPAAIASRTKITVATLAPASYPPEGREFFRQYAEEYEERQPDPYAIYGYEAMRLALDAIERSETGEREDIVKALFDTEDRTSVLGTYSIDDNGDTTLTDYGVYTIDGGELKFDQTVTAET